LVYIFKSSGGEIIHTISGSNHKHSLIGWLLLGGLLFLRFPLLTIAGIVLSSDSPTKSIVMFIYAGGTYLLTAIMIWWERENLHNFWIDLTSLITFVGQIFYFPIYSIPVNIGLFIGLWRSRSKIPTPKTRIWHWVLIGAILAFVSTIITTSLNLVPPLQPRTEAVPGFAFLFPAFLVQLTQAAVLEEPLFRGFLWGTLRKIHWSNHWIWIFQAALFTVGHVYYLQQEAFIPWLIRMLIPSLIVGFVAWQARSIFASMVTHAVFNASGDMLMHTRSLSEAINYCWIVVGILGILLILVWLADHFFRKTIKGQPESF
jgi:membrane protease YdiL (CAAX protease family)